MFKGCPVFRQIALAGLLILTAWSGTAAGAAPRVVHYVVFGDDAYYQELLKLALRHSGRYQAEPVAAAMTQKRLISDMASGHSDVDVIWTMTSLERERSLRPVRIPLVRGLLGLRLFLVRSREAERLRAPASLAELKAWSLGQGHDWPDTAILRHAGLTVETSSNYPALFEMLRQGRIQAFPRSVTEIWSELDSDRGRDLSILPGLALYYPAPEYFFVRIGDDELADALERGLAAALKDGSFDSLFQRYMGPHIQRAALDKRRILTLPNPDLPPLTPLDTPGYWYFTARPGQGD